MADDDVFKSTSGAPKKKSNFIAAMGNFSIQYNLSAASVVLSPGIMGDLFPQPSWAKYSLKGVVFAGTIVGMCVMGYLGDLLGRKRAMIFTLALTVLGALGCALFPWGYHPDTVYGLFCLSRFILGVGVGGIYPLSAATASEASHSKDSMAKDVGFAFFWQTPGAMAPYLVGLLLFVSLDQSTFVEQVEFRLIMGLGALPASIVLLATLDFEESAEFQLHKARNPLHEALEHRQYWRVLVGTAGTWFLYDVAYYGTNIFTPDIIQSIFGDEDNTQLCWHSLVAQAIGIIGCLLAIFLLKPKGVYWLMLWGFAFIAVLFAAFATVYNISKDGYPALKFVLFCMLTLALNFGPNVATFVLPAISFPSNVRGIFHGLSAASAKVGAVVGTFIFNPISSAWGVAGVMWVQVVLCVLGVVITYFFVERDEERQRRQDEEAAPLLDPINRLAAHKA